MDEYYNMQSIDTSTVSAFGYILTVLPSTHLGWKFRFYGDNYEQFQRPIYECGFSRPGAFVDVGANVGYYVLLAKHHDINKRIYAIEPGPLNMHCLISTIWRNNLTGCTPMMAFAMDRHGFGTWSRNDESCFALSLEDREVPFIKLDDINIGKVGFVKIDTEGAESSVLKGFSTTLKRDKPVLMVEVCDRHLKNQSSSIDELMDLLKELGYSQFEVYDYERNSIVKCDGAKVAHSYLKNLVYGADMKCV